MTRTPQHQSNLERIVARAKELLKQTQAQQLKEGKFNQVFASDERMRQVEKLVEEGKP